MIHDVPPGEPGSTEDTVASDTSGSPVRRDAQGQYPDPEKDQISVAVFSKDRLIKESVLLALCSTGLVTSTPTHDLDQADVILLLANDFDEYVMDDVARMMKGTRERIPPLVLVCRRIGEVRLLQAVDLGLVSVLLWEETDIRALARVVLDSTNGIPKMPGDALNLVLKRLRAIRKTDSPSAQVSARDIDVIRLLADGFSTAAIADRLKFSERTIKSILANLMTRFGLENRAHLVAFAFRNGII
jgi:DNA-binding NarL/FixJ family response regulator